MNFKIYISLLLFSFSIITSAQVRNIDNQLRLAKSYEDVNNFEDAEKIYSDLIKAEPTNYNIYKSYNDLLLKMKKYEESIKLIESQLAQTPNNIDLYGDLGSVYYLIGNQEKADEYWTKGITLDSENPFSYRVIANYLVENRLIEKAIDILRTGNSKSDDPTIFSYDIANLYSLTMKFEEATEEYCKIIQQKPKQENIVKNRILGYLNSPGAVEPTLKVVENYYDNEGNSIYLDLLIDLYLRTDNFKKGLEAAIKLEKATTNNGSVLYNYALQSSRFGNHEFAAQAYQNIIQNFPNSILIAQAEIGYTREIESNLRNKFTKKDEWKQFSQPSYDKNEFIKLLQAYKNLAKKYPSEKVGIEAEYRSGLIYQIFLEDYKKADSVFQKIISNGNASEFISQAYFGLAKIALVNGNLSEAQNYLEDIIDQKNVAEALLVEAKYTLAKTEMWQGNFETAIKRLNEVKIISADENANDALQLLLILNTFKKDSVNLILFVNADYNIEKNKFKEAAADFKKLAENKSLFLLKDFAAVNYVELLLTLNNYQEAIIFLEEISNCDEDNIFKDRFLYLLGASYFYGLHNAEKASVTLTRIFEEFPNSIYSGKARKIISEIKSGEKNSI
ncbi:MAG: tetratricopeptide repeat protein [Ignavibacteriae bacterium]|nr:tetratricopeptide repeat protein [Ignavibacteriota bacterium]